MFLYSLIVNFLAHKIRFLGKVYKLVYVYRAKIKFTVYLPNPLVYLMLAQQPLTTLLESYVFDVSARIINRASSQNQTLLINLLNTIGTLSSDNTDTVPAINLASGTFLESPLGHLQKQWQEALSRPMVKENEADEAGRERIHRAIAANQRQIEATLQHIRTMASLISRAKLSSSKTPLQSRMLSHYRAVQDYYQAHLVMLNTLQERKLRLLGQ